MTIVDTVGQSLGGFAWASLGQALFIFIIFFIVLFIFGFLSFFIWYKSYNVKVTIFQPLGQVAFTEEELKEMQEEAAKGIKSSRLKEIKFDYIKKRTTHGKYNTIKGVAYFCMFMPLKKIKPVPLTLMYNTGVYLIQLSRDVFIPVQKPSFVITVYENVSISVAEQQEWISWSNMMADRINAKYQNPDADKKQTLYFVIGIAAMVIVGGLILWFIYSSAKKGLDVKAFTENFAKTIQAAPSTLIPK